MPPIIPLTVPRRDMLAIAGVHVTDWNNAMHNGLIPYAPAGSRGVHRRFAVNDLVAANILGYLRDRQVNITFAAGIAVRVQEILSQPDCPLVVSVWKVGGQDGRPKVTVAELPPRSDCIELFRFQLAEMRERMRAGISAALSEES